MFGFSGGESAETVARKKGHMRDAQARWPFLTRFDLSTIKTEPQLAVMVKERSGISREEAACEVRSWAAERQF